MKDLTNPRWIKVKGVLFLLLGVLSGALLILEQPSLRIAALICLTIWCFCRSYYFAFYVIEHYVDPATAFPGCGHSPGTCSRSASADAVRTSHTRAGTHLRGNLARICFMISRVRSFVAGWTPSSGAK